LFTKSKTAIKQVIKKNYIDAIIKDPWFFMRKMKDIISSADPPTRLKNKSRNVWRRQMLMELFNEELVKAGVGRELHNQKILADLFWKTWSLSMKNAKISNLDIRRSHLPSHLVSRFSKKIFSKLSRKLVNHKDLDIDFGFVLSFCSTFLSKSGYKAGHAPIVAKLVWEKLELIRSEIANSFDIGIASLNVNHSIHHASTAYLQHDNIRIIVVQESEKVSWGKSALPENWVFHGQARTCSSPKAPNTLNGGGVGILCHPLIDVNVVKETGKISTVEAKCAEWAWWQLQYGTSFDVVVGSIYVPPTANMDFIALQKDIDHLSSLNVDNIILCGDININLMDDGGGGNGGIDSWKKFLSGNGFKWYNSGPTRKDNTLDYIFYKCKGHVPFKRWTNFPSSSDHNLLMCNVSIFVDDHFEMSKAKNNAIRWGKLHFNDDPEEFNKLCDMICDSMDEFLSLVEGVDGDAVGNEFMDAVISSGAMVLGTKKHASIVDSFSKPWEKR
jgi:hypothetical protein